MKRLSFVLTAWLLLALPASAEIINGGIIGGGGDLIAKASPTARLDADQLVYTDAAIQFNSPDKSRLAMGTNWNPGVLDFAVSAHIYLDTSTATQTIICTGGTSNGQDGFCLQIDSDGNVLLGFNDSVQASRLTATFTTALADTTWYHLLLYCDRSGDATLYVDGVADNVTLAISTHNADLGATGGNIGSDLTPNNYFNGRLDSLMLFEKADLSSVIAAMASALYNSGEGMLATDLTATQITDWGGKYAYDLGETSGVRYSATGFTANNLTPTFASIIAPPVYGTSLIASANPGFETAGAGDPDFFGSWVETAGDGAIADETTAVQAGSHAAKLTAGATANTCISTATLTVTASTNYRLSFWACGDGTNAGRYGIYNVTASADITAATSTTVTGTNYTLRTYDFTTPAGCTGIRVDLWCPSTNTGVAYYDTIAVSAVTTAAINNGGFDSWTVPSAAEKVVNGNFDVDIAGWTNHATLGWETAEHNGSGGMHLACGGDGVPNYCIIDSTAFGVTSGSVYRLSYTVTRAAGYIGVKLTGVPAGLASYYDALHNTAGTNTYTTYFRATATDETHYLEFYIDNLAAHDWTIDNVSIVEVPSNADTWTEELAGSSLIYREDTAPYHGSHALAMQVGAAASKAAIQLASNLTVGKTYSYTIYAKAASGTPGIRVGTATTYNTETLSTSYAAKTNTFVADATTLEISCVTASATVYLDSLTELATVVMPQAGIVRGLAIHDDDVSYWQSLTGSVAAEITTLAKRPAYDTTTNSFAVLSADGVDDVLETSIVPGDAGTIVCVLSGGADGDIYVGMSEGSEAVFISNVGGIIAAGAGDSPTRLASNEDPTTGYRIVVFVWGGNGQPQFLMVDGVVEDTETQNAEITVTEPFYLFCENDDGTAANYAEASIAYAVTSNKAISQSHALGITKRLQNSLGLSP